MPSLDVWLYGGLAGRLAAPAEAGLTFTYERAWSEAGRPALSVSLPLRAEPFSGAVVGAFFSNLLPEGEVRRVVARQFGISVGNDFSLLEAIGGDCAGALSLVAPGAPGPGGGGPEDVRWLEEAEFAATIGELPARPLMADPDGGVRLSLAGAQDKLPVISRDGRIGIPRGNTPSTHILKAPIRGLDHTVINEAFCLRLSRNAGIQTASAALLQAGHEPVLLVERYDRRLDGDAVERVHQEDLCQARGVTPERKYEAEGGPGLAECFSVLREACHAPARNLVALLDAVALNFLIGNHDAHAKNFSLLHEPAGTRLAPLYDLVSTAVYPELDRKMAMKLGGEYRPDRVERRHFERFANESGLGWGATRRRLAGWAERAPDLAASTAAELRGEGWDAPVLESIQGIVNDRCTLLGRAA